MKTNISLFAILLCLGLSSCSPWLNVEPEGEATDEKLYQTGDGYRTALAGVYTQMASKSLYGMELGFGFIDCLSQQYTWDWSRGAMGQGKSLYNKAADFEYKDKDVIALVDDMWLTGYNVIANANNLIMHVQGESADKFAYGEMERDMILGEAYACRGLMHFDLARLFMPAPVENDKSVNLPYVTDYPNIQPSGVDMDKYLDNVVKDLTEAAKLTMHFDTTAIGMALNANTRARFYNEIPNGMETKMENGEAPDDFLKLRAHRLNYYAVNAVLSRVYMYMGKYDKAEEHAQIVMDAKAVGLKGGGTEIMTYKDENFEGVRQTDDPEEKKDLKIESNMIFALHNENAYNDYNIESHFRKSVKDNNLAPWFILEFRNRKIFENRGTNADEYENDYRGKKMLFQPDYDSFKWNPDLKRVYSLKYYPGTNTKERDAALGKIPVIRTSEVCYILSECAARKGDYTKAYEILNEIRQNRGLWDPLPEAGNFDDFLADLVRDAQREFISEGQLFFLYKRLGYPCVYADKKMRPMNKAEYMAPIPVNQNF